MKASLRSEARRIRKAIPRPRKEQIEFAIAEQLLTDNWYLQCSTLLSYAAFGSEIDPARIIRHALTHNKTVAFPYCRETVMQFYRIHAVDDYQIGPFGAPEPFPREESLVVPDASTICLVPGLLFDRRGFRLGYGGGFYDRYLSVYSVRTVGLTAECLLVDALPTETHDRPVNRIVTERCTYYLNCQSKEGIHNDGE